MSSTLVEPHQTVPVLQNYKFLQRLFAFAGPGFLIAVGYMDPGNWATDLEAGSRFGYQLLWVLLLANLMAVLLQTLSARLGIVTGRDLAQASRDHFPPVVAFWLWVLAEIAITACDLAEVLGTAIALQLLFGIPLLIGVVLTGADVLLLLTFQQFGMRKVEAFILALVLTVGGCFLVELFLAKPLLSEAITGFVPKIGSESFYIAIGIIGATVMPHNLYLHSALVQTRSIGSSPAEMKQACKFNLIDSLLALNLAFFVNAAILILAATVFFKNGQIVTEISQAHSLLSPLLGTTLASVVFAVALLSSGQSSTMTGTFAGQIVMEGFVQFKIRPWLRRMITRALAIIPAVVVILIMGDHGTYRLLILSQVVLSLQLPFAVIPLIHITSSKRAMGEFANKPWVIVLAWIIAAIIVGLNLWLVFTTVGEWLTIARWSKWLIVPAGMGLSWLLLYVIIVPLVKQRKAAEAKIPEFAVVGLVVPKYTRIGVALEATANDQALLQYAIPEVQKHGAKLLLLHVAEGVGPRFWTDESTDTEVRRDEQYLTRLSNELGALKIDNAPVLGFGDPIRELIRMSREQQLDLLSLGTHGHGFPGDLLFGATADKVRHKLNIPVMMVRVDKLIVG